MVKNTRKCISIDKVSIHFRNFGSPNWILVSECWPEAAHSQWNYGKIARNVAPYGLRGGNSPRFICWFRLYASCLFVYLTFLFSSFLMLSSLLLYFLTHLLPNLSTSGIDPLRFQVGGRRWRSKFSVTKPRDWEERLWNGLFCVRWDVKPNSINVRNVAESPKLNLFAWNWCRSERWYSISDVWPAVDIFSFLRTCITLTFRWCDGG